MGIVSSEFSGLRWYTNGTTQGTRRSRRKSLAFLYCFVTYWDWLRCLIVIRDLIGLNIFLKGHAYLCSLVCNYYWSFVIFMVILPPRTSIYHIYTGKDRGSITSLGITIKAKGKRKYTGVSGKTLLHWWCNCFLKTSTEIDTPAEIVNLFQNFTMRRFFVEVGFALAVFCRLVPSTQFRRKSLR